MIRRPCVQRAAAALYCGRYSNVSHIAAAKKGGKKGGKGKGGNKKGGSLLGELAAKPKIQPWQSTDVIMQHLLMVESYRKAVGTPLMEDIEIEAIADALWDAPFALLAHDKGACGEDEPRFTYANKKALEVFEGEWGELVGQVSSVCLPPDEAARADRQALLERTADDIDKGYTSDYTGSRISLKGTPFELLNVTLWNIRSPTGKLMGQAAWFDAIKTADGTIVHVGEETTAVPTAEEIESQRARVEEQGAAVRELKEARGLGNSDPAVQDAVAELLARKEMLAWMEEAAAAAAAVDTDNASEA